MIVCENCGKETEKHSSVQKYCPECSALKRQESLKRYNDKNVIQSKGQKIKNKENRAKRDINMRKKGVEINLLSLRDMGWIADSPLDLSWNVKIKIPFTYAVSKNHIWSVTSKGHVYQREENKSIRDLIIYVMREALKGKKVYQGKLWIDILVQKPDHRGDAINVVDTVCDGLKVATGVDDRWYSIRRLDWEVSKNEPMLIIGIGQEISEDQRICSYCGRELPESDFYAGRRECSECRGSRRMG